MMNRRSFLKSANAAAAALYCAQFNSLHRADAEQPVDASDLASLVDLRIGTGGHGHTFPGATVPFGMVQLSPDTYNDGWDWCSGYHYSDSSIMGFSHTHLSGTGVGDMLDVLVMPGTGTVKLEPGSREHPEDGYRSRFSHEEEIAEPGYYSVLLRDYGIRAELSATERAGMHRYTFPKSDSGHFMIDLAHAYGNDPDIVLWSNLTVVGNDTIIGGRSTNQWAKGRQIYFAMKFSRPFQSVAIYSGDQRLDSASRHAEGKALRLVAEYSTSQNEAILVKTGISGVSTDGAVKNLAAEMPGWDFDAIRRSARLQWQRELGKIQIEDSNRGHVRVFYTSLYHAMLSPTIFDDVDGQYRGMDGAVHVLERGAHNYSTYSLWDTFRAMHPLFTIIQPERVPDMVNCLIRMSHESLDGPPVWPLQAEETGCMTGYHSAVVIAEAIAKGFAGIDYAAAYGPLRQRAMRDDYRGLDNYRKYGYLPCDLNDESASKTLDYAYDDWAVARVAQAAGALEDHALLAKRSGNYRNLFDPATGFVRPRFANREWAGPFDPKEISITRKWRDYTESNAWQTTFAVQHDPEGLIDLFGGRSAFLAKLDALFNQSTDLPPDTPPDVAGLVGMYAHGNEPSHHIAYLYCYAGAPYKTQARVRSLLETMYRDDPDGLAGNEDCGQMSAWYVISALGFYAVDPVSANYVFGTPLFDRVRIQVGNGKHLVIEARRNKQDDCYIDAIDVNGAAWNKIWFRHTDIANGASIVFHMKDSPNTTFGAGQQDAPPSASAA